MSVPVATHLLGNEGLLITPVGDGQYLVGQVFVHTITQTSGSWGEWEVEVEARVRGDLVVTTKKPTLTSEASVLELAREINQRIKARG